MPTNDWIGDLCHAAVDNRCCAREMRMPASSAKRSFFQISANGCLEPKVQNAALCKNVSFSRSEIGCVVPVTSSFMVNCDLELSTCFSAIS